VQSPEFKPQFYQKKKKKKADGNVTSEKQEGDLIDWGNQEGLSVQILPGLSGQHSCLPSVGQAPSEMGVLSPAKWAREDHGSSKMERQISLCLTHGFLGEGVLSQESSGKPQ
jgi:hypothetical protein